MLGKGIFVFSWDFELAFGFQDKDRLPSKFYSYNSRKYINKLIDILENFRIPSTWATVGHLFLDRCEMGCKRPHPDVKAPNEEWYSKDPCTNIDKDPIWYGKDIIERLISLDPNQEIGCHTFSHIDTESNKEILVSEFEKFKEVMPKGLHLSSFVSPRHKDVPKDVLKDMGFTNYREPPTNPSTIRALKFYSGLSGPPTGLPVQDQHGLWGIPVNTFFFYQPLHKFQRKFPSIKLRWFNAGLRNAARNKEVFHVWAHPHNFIGDNQSINQFKSLMENVATLRESGLIEPVTTDTLAKILS